jgi:hypothetical protein
VVGGLQSLFGRYIFGFMCTSKSMRIREDGKFSWRTSEIAETLSVAGSYEVSVKEDVAVEK